jgi:Protein of unknown function (DUF726)
MPLIAVNAAGEVPVLTARHEAQIAALPPGAPVTVMMHGFRFTPYEPENCPHGTLFAATPAPLGRRTPSWARRLGLMRDGGPGAGLAIGFGWRANGTIWQAHDRAAEAGLALATLVARLRAAGAGPVGLIGHSLGGRVALSALPHLTPGDIGRIALLSAAEFQEPAAAALASPAGRAAEVLNITSRENDAFDLMFEMLIGGPLRRRGLTLAAGLRLPNVATVQIDCPAHRAALRALGFPTAAPISTICHWSAYLRPGLFPLYRAFLHRPGELPLSRLQAALPERTAWRWSRLVEGVLPAGALAPQ